MYIAQLPHISSSLHQKKNTSTANPIVVDIALNTYPFLLSDKSSDLVLLYSTCFNSSVCLSLKLDMFSIFV